MRVTIKSIKKKHCWVYVQKLKNCYVFYDFFGHPVDEANTLTELDAMIDDYANDPSDYIDRQLRENYGDYYDK